MSNNQGLERFIILFIPWGMSLLLSSDPYISYFIAWLGSFLIFILTLSGWVKKIPGDLKAGEQMMRPIFILHIIFAGYMCTTSIFYLLNVLGYRDFAAPPGYFLPDMEKLALTAQCQRYYCLAHASFCAGVLSFMKYPEKKKYYTEQTTLSNLIMNVALISFPLSLLFVRIPGLSQFYFQLNSLSFIAGTLSLALAIPQKKPVNTLISAVLYIFNFYQALISGFKEPIIISILVLGLFLYPSYKRFVMLTFIPALFMLFLVLPAYVNTYRQNAWSDDVSADEAAQLSLDAAITNDNDSYWDFLVFRLSEIDMFTAFVQSTPEHVDYYGTNILKQSAIAIVPRMFWPTKPITEDLVMERVYQAGVVNRLSKVSAKPAFVVDAYLSGGNWGIFLSMFIYGALAQRISVKSEELFGGYFLGTALVFSGLFQIFWRGLSFEFLINSVFWSYITMLVLFQILRQKKILKPV